MSSMNTRSAAILGILLAAGLIGLGVLAGEAAKSVKMFERVVTAKGLSEREVPADTVIWPIVVQLADNDLNQLFQDMEASQGKVRAFLTAQGIEAEAITATMPAVTDLYASNYANTANIRYRYNAKATTTVYSRNVDTVRQAMRNIVELGKQGIAVTGDQYESKPQFLFTGLSELKPSMVEEATNNARAVAQKFAEDSDSRLGKIKYARQGQFSIQDRDSSTPHIKKVRVVSTLEYYLSD